MHGALTVQFTVWNETCGNTNGAIEAWPSGGVFPYTYVWSNGAVNYLNTGLAPGWYVLTITDAVNQVLVDSAEVLAVPNLQWPGPTPFPQAGLFGCNGCNAGVHVPSDPVVMNWHNVVGPITVLSPTPFAMMGADFIMGPYCTFDSPSFLISDATGCTGSVGPATVYVSPGGSPQLISTEGACLGSNGSLTVAPWGGGYTIDQNTVMLYDTGWNLVQSCGNCGFPDVTFSGLASGDYHVVRLEDNYDPWGMNCPPETLDVTVPDLGPTCGQVTGSVFFDHDQDCVQDPNDEAIPFRVLEITPGPEYAITDMSGHFTRNLAYGNYSLDQQAGADLVQLCPAASPVPFTLSNLTPVVDLPFADSSSIALDLSVSSASGPHRLGFNAQHWFEVRNLSGQISGPITVEFTIDALLSFTNALPAPTSIAGNTLTWNLPSLGAFASHHVYVSVGVPPVPGLLGSPVSCTITAGSTLAESTLNNNGSTNNSVITGAYDPNDKAVLTSTRASTDYYYINQDEWVDYTIRFQNTGTDTAFTVVVTDTLDTDLDLSSYLQGVASHPFTVQFMPERVVKWTFSNILLPDSNTNEPLSHGLVSFRIKPELPLLPGTVLSNNADIFFDFNPPIRTNDAVVTAEFSTGIGSSGGEAVRMWPNPAGNQVFAVTDHRTVAVHLLSADGRLIKTAGPTGSLTTIDLSGLASGLYAVSLVLSDGHRIRAPLAKY